MGTHNNALIPSSCAAGHLLVPWVTVLPQIDHYCLVAAAVVTTGRIQHLLLEMITSVITHQYIPMALSLMTHCGMVLGVVPPAPAAHSTTLHGSARPSPSPPLMTWRSGSVMNLRLETHLSSLWKFTCSSV